MCFFDRFNLLCKQNKVSMSKVLTELGLARSNITYWQSNPDAMPKKEALEKIAEYFNVSYDYLLGKDLSNTPAVSDHDLKVALFNGSEDVTDEMWEEVKNFARFVEEREANKRRKE